MFRELCKPDAALSLTLTLAPDSASVVASQREDGWLARGRITRDAETAPLAECADGPLSQLATAALDQSLAPSDEQRARVLRLKHRGSALLLACELGEDEAGHTHALSVQLPDWHLPLLMDAAAQAAGLSAKSASGNVERTLVVVAYDRVALGAPACGTRLLFRTRTVRRVRGMLQQRVEAFQRTGPNIEKVLQLEVSLAPLPASEQPSSERPTAARGANAQTNGVND